MTAKIEFKQVVVTGGASGIGAGICELLAARSCSIVIADRAADPARQLAAKLRSEGFQAEAVALDVSDPIEIVKFFGARTAHPALPNALVNCAGVNVRASVLDFQVDDWQRVLDVNLRGTALMGREFAKNLIQAGSPGTVVNIASMLAHYSAPNLAAYASSKGGVAMLTRSEAVEWAPFGIRVNAVSPGYIQTSLTTKIFSVTRYRETLLRRTPMRRLGDPEDVARVVAFLISEDSRFVTGQIIPVDGGITAGDPTLAPASDQEVAAMHSSIGQEKDESSSQRAIAGTGASPPMNQANSQRASTVNDLRRLIDRSAWVRQCVVDLAAIAGSGHIGPALSCTDVLVALYYGYMNIDPKQPNKIDRDRFILSKGHACSALYPILADLGYFPVEELSDFTQLRSILGDHPNMRKVPGIDFSSGSLGHGLSIGIGMSEAGRFRNTTERVIVMLGDGELNEGQIWEAAGYASARKLGNLLAVVDKNHVQVDGKTTDVLNFEPLDEKFRAFGWNVEEINGHEFSEILSALDRFDRRRSQAGASPTVIFADTVSGKGIPFIEGMPEWHIGFLAGEDYDRAVIGINAVHAKD